MYSLSTHYSNEQAPTWVRDLTDTETLALLDSKHEEHQPLLQVLRNQRLWVVCACRVPTTIKMFSETKKHHLVKVRERESHQTSCPLFTLTDDKSPSDKTLAKQAGTSFTFSTEAAPVKTIVAKMTGSREGEVAPRTDQLYSLVASLLTDAGANRVDLLNVTFDERKGALRQAAMKYSLGGKSLREYLYFGFGSVKEATSDLEKRGALWVGRHRPQALMLAHAEKLTIDGNNWIIQVKDNWTITVGQECKVTRLNGVFSLNRGPFLVACILSEVKDDDAVVRFKPTRIFVAPVINSTSYMILDSNLERTFAKIALKVLLNLPMAHELRLVKPLFAIHVNQKPILPDFILSTPTSRVIFEVMGKGEGTDYHDRKQGVIPLMEQVFGKVICVGTSTHSSNELFYKEVLEQFETAALDLIHG